jgi:phage gp36-like protein
MALLENYYINETDLKSYINNDELTNITEEIDAGTGGTNIQLAIKNVCALADTYLKQKYDLPLASTINTAPLKSMIAKKVVWDISNLYTSLSDEVRKIRESYNNEAMDYFDNLAKGTITLIDSNIVETLAQADKYYFDANVRITREFY